jgi:two-component system CheB/CheR fusion protein
MSSPEISPGFESLLEYLRVNRGSDFTGYKRATLTRRIVRRMQSVGVERFDDYIDYLEVHPDEFTLLFNTILINVTGFFRDPEAWDALTRDVVTRISEAKGSHQPIRVWSAGCASGEEAYTLVMVLAEALGLERFKQQVKIYATDLDEEALAEARQAVYDDEALETVPEALRERYFGRNGSGYIFRGDLRLSVIFGRHDLVQDAPISHLDLLVCRNSLMYFNAETQTRILNRLHFALRDTGFIFLGRAEMLLAHGNLFTPVQLKHRIFAKVPSAGARNRSLILGRKASAGDDTGLEYQLRLRDAALDAEPAAQVVVDPAGTLVLANAMARTTFGLNSRDLGRPLQDFEFSYRPAELRSPIEQVRTERRPVYLKNIDWRGVAKDDRQYDIQIVPLLENGDSLLGVSVTFLDVTPYERLKNELQQATQQLETAYEEVQSTNEELETTNEELQSTIEELETTNEELQSTNEELETMNEELHSTNEELETINDELYQRTTRLNQVNVYLESILSSLRVGVIVLDKELNVRIWNRQAEELWGLRPEEVHGRALLNLDIGLPVAQLKSQMRACIDGSSVLEEVTMEATNRRGRTIRCRVTCAPLRTTEGQTQGVIILMEDRDGDVAAR